MRSDYACHQTVEPGLVSKVGKGMVARHDAELAVPGGNMGDVEVLDERPICAVSAFAGEELCSRERRFGCKRKVRVAPDDQLVVEASGLGQIENQLGLRLKVSADELLVHAKEHILEVDDDEFAIGCSCLLHMRDFVTSSGRLESQNET